MQRFWDKVDKTTTCWLWTASTRNGYGCFKYQGKARESHRFAYELCIEPIPSGMIICHKCDVRLCVNPDHLFLGTYHDNTIQSGIDD